MVGLGLARGWARVPTPAGPQLITLLPWLTTTLGWLLPWRDPPPPFGRPSRAPLLEVPC